jgi:hypothetical protein
MLFYLFFHASLAGAGFLEPPPPFQSEQTCRAAGAAFARKLQATYPTTKITFDCVQK